MCVYLCTKFQVSSITLTSFRQGVISSPILKRTCQYPTQISVKRPSGQLNKNLILILMIRCKYYKANHHLRKYLSCHSTLGRYMYRIYRTETDPWISPSVQSRGYGTFCRQHHQLLFHPYSHHSMILPNCCIAAMDLAAAPPEVLLH